MSSQAVRVRSNEEWLHDLRSEGEVQGQALADLRAHLVRSALFYLRRRSSELREVAPDELDALAEDSAQESVVYILKKLDTFRGEAKFLTWASRFSVGRAIMTLRRLQWRDLSLDRMPDGWGAPATQAVSPDGWEHPELAARRQEIWSVIREVVENELTDLQRQAFDAILLKGLPMQIVAERMGTSPNSMYKLVHDARRKLKKGLERRGWSVDEMLDAFSSVR